MSDHSTPAGKDQRIRPESLSKKFNLMNLLDPRSPTTAFQRTPIQVILQNSKINSTEECSDEITPKTASVSSASFFSLSSPQATRDESLELSASSASFVSLENLTDMDSINLSSDDLSILVSDLSSPCKKEIEEEFPHVADEEVHRRKESDFSSFEADIEKEPLCLVNDEVDRSIEEKSIELELIEKERINVTPEQSVISPSQEGSNTANNTNQDISSDKLLENAVIIRKKPLKNIFYTPNPNRKRNPLGTVDNTCPTTPPSRLYGSPQNALCEKQWKRIQVERKKLGLEADENAHLPLYDITASAPSKLIRKSRLRTHHKGMLS